MFLHWTSRNEASIFRKVKVSNDKRTQDWHLGWLTVLTSILIILSWNKKIWDCKKLHVGAGKGGRATTSGPYWKGHFTHWTPLHHFICVLRSPCCPVCDKTRMNESQWRGVQTDHIIMTTRHPPFCSFASKEPGSCVIFPKHQQFLRLFEGHSKVFFGLWLVSDHNSILCDVGLKNKYKRVQNK